MAEAEMPAQDAGKAPGLVLFAAILNFIAAGIAFLLAAFAALAMLYGNFFGIADYLNREVAPLTEGLAISAGVNFLLTVLLILGALVAAGSAVLGVALLRARRWAWFGQVISSVFGLLGFPVGTVLNAVILVGFFRNPIRSYFKV